MNRVETNPFSGEGSYSSRLIVSRNSSGKNNKIYITGKGTEPFDNVIESKEMIQIGTGGFNYPVFNYTTDNNAPGNICPMSIVYGVIHTVGEENPQPPSNSSLYPPIVLSNGNGEFILDREVNMIYYRMFYEDEHLISVVIPDFIEEISGELFVRCPNLRTITIGRNVKYDFYDTNLSFDLTEMTGEFCVDKGVETLIIRSPKIAEFILTGGEYIKDYWCIRQWFEQSYENYPKTVIFDIETNTINRPCNELQGMETVEFGSNITRLGDGCFNDCTSLKDINYGGNMAQWAEISKGTDWKKNVPSTAVVHCTNGDIPITEA